RPGPADLDGRRPVQPISRLAAGVALAALTIMLAACSSAGAASSGVLTLATPSPAASAGAAASADPSASPGSSGKPRPEALQEALLAYAQCMRDHGVDMPDPEFKAIPGGAGGGGGGIAFQVGVGGPDNSAASAADQACHHLIAGVTFEGGGGKQMSP